MYRPASLLFFIARRTTSPSATKTLLQGLAVANNPKDVPRFAAAWLLRLEARRAASLQKHRRTEPPRDNKTVLVPRTLYLVCPILGLGHNKTVLVPRTLDLVCPIQGTGRWAGSFGLCLGALGSLKCFQPCLNRRTIGGLRTTYGRPPRKTAQALLRPEMPVALV